MGKNICWIFSLFECKPVYVEKCSISHDSSGSALVFQTQDLLFCSDSEPHTLTQVLSLALCVHLSTLSPSHSPLLPHFILSFSFSPSFPPSLRAPTVSWLKLWKQTLAELRWLFALGQMFSRNWLQQRIFNIHFDASLFKILTNPPYFLNNLNSSIADCETSTFLCFWSWCSVFVL